MDDKDVCDLFLSRHFQEDTKPYIIIDEAHCVVDWGDNFRPSFKKLNKLRAIFPKGTILAMTATLSVKGQEDVAKLLGMKDHKTVSTYPAKDNISLVCVQRPPAISSEEGSAHLSVEYCVEPLLIELLDKGQDFPLTIVYFSGSQNWVGLSYELAINLLGSEFYVDQQKTETARVAMFHASLEKGSDKLRQSIMKNLSMDPKVSPLKLIFSTIALGMGADLASVKRVIQIGPPKTMEAYVQQIGRAGRSGEQAVSVLFYNKSDIGRPEVVEDMKKLCRSETICRRKIVNSSFGFDDYPQVPTEMCCDICNPNLASSFKHETRVALKSTLRNTILSYITEDLTGYLRQVIMTSTIEQIVCQPQKFSTSESLKSAFSLNDYVAAALAKIVTSVLEIHH